MRISARPATLPATRGFTLGVSLGSANNGAAVTAAAADWINTSPFDYGIVDLADALHRFNLMENGVEEGAAHQAARALGDRWLEDNAGALSAIKKPVRVIRWDHWLVDPRFQDTLAKTRAAFDTHTQLRHAVYSDIAAYCTRRALPMTEDRARRGIAYYLEEIAAHSLLHTDFDVTSLYAGRQPESMRLIRSGAVPDLQGGLAASRFVRLVPHTVPDRPDIAWTRPAIQAP